MAQKFTLFEEQFDANYYVKVESDFDSQMLFGSVNSLLMTESLSAGSPIMVLRFLDALGVLVNTTYISPDANYDVYFGHDQFTSKKGSFSLSANEGRSLGQGNIENVSMDINFLSNKWLQTLAKPQSRSWNNAYYSDVVQQIAEECGFTDIMVEKSSDAFSVIQPGWSNYKLLRWIAQHAKSSSGAPGYELMIRSDGSFAFQTFSTLFKKAPVRNLYLASPDVAKNVLYGLNIIQQYAPMVREGATGAHYTYYDYDNRQFVSGDLNLSGTQQNQLSDWFFVSDKHDVSTRRFDGGRDVDMATVVEANIANTANSIQEIRTTILGDVGLHIGDIVNVILTPSKNVNQPFNEMYSGYWMISRVTQIVDFKQKQVRTDLRMMRAGLNGIGIQNLTKSAAGKQIAKNTNPTG